jgi:hypothetical protein
MVNFNHNSPKTVYKFFMVLAVPYFSKELKVRFGP